MTFPEAVPIILEVYNKVDSDSEVWKNASEDFLMLGEKETGGQYDDIALGPGINARLSRS